MNRSERIEYLLSTFNGYPWLRILNADGKADSDLTREDCDLIAQLLWNEVENLKTKTVT